ncbi:ATP-grasp ribosomal peptide maturase [Plantactinospora mayteni]|uniref:ATP-grasp ribosomal peptide maturase n=1 Tax=Plantactinospora mayteni TaxID=566021 RepID=A0ABQ4EHS9_9ACTN|nr:ATP-grasp ribosomal peptide maturase [Plantactinospora mayteni]GIG94273.1 ATP-grasp ribosomal peptide maturase [Plantactinospora mayteni]
MTVLILTHPLDLTTDLVVAALVERGTPVARFDLAQFPQDLTLDARLVHGQWTGSLADSHRRVDLDGVTAVYYRRPSPFVLPAMSDPERVWAADEARHGIGGVLASLPCRWVNHPGRNAAASYKPVQLTTAVECGLDVPATLITNDQAAARQFVTATADGAVYKPLYGSPAEPGWALFTSRVTADQLGPSVAATAHTFQAYVPKSHEVRLTFVGDRLFPTRIDAGSAAAELDWRTDYDALTYERTEVPPDVAAAVRRLMAALGLRFGALDFVVTPENRWIFLEINANGQWAWIERATGLPIAAAVAAELSTPGVSP